MSGEVETNQRSDNISTWQLTNRDHSIAITQKSEAINGATEAFDYTYDDLNANELTKIFNFRSFPSVLGNANELTDL